MEDKKGHRFTFTAVEFSLVVLDLTNFTVATSCICHQMSFQLKTLSFHGHQSTLSMVFSLASLIVPV